MRVELAYDPDHDSIVSRSGLVEVGGQLLYVSAGTVAGRRFADGDPHPNEDVFSVASDGESLVAGVFDGASSQRPIPELDGKSGARFASHTLKEELEALPYMDDAYLTLQGLNRVLGERLRAFPSVDYTDMNSLPTSTGTFGRFRMLGRHPHLGIGHVSDSFAISLHESGTTTLLTDNRHRAHDQNILQFIHEIAIRGGMTPREAKDDPRVKEAIMAMFQKTRNRPNGNGEGIINGDPNMDQYIYTTSLPLRGMRAVLFGSDGLVPPGMSEDRPTDRKRMFEIVLSGGVPALIDYAREEADKDPDRWHLRYKHVDDSTGVLVQSPYW